MRVVKVEVLPEPPHAVAGEQVVPLPMASEDRRRIRRRIQAPDGQDLALALPTGTVLRPGRVIHREPGRAYVVSASAEDVLVLNPRNVEEAVRAGHLIGNLHQDIDLSGGVICVLWNKPLEAQLRGLGFVIERDSRPFYGDPVSGHNH